MSLKRRSRTKDGKPHIYYAVCESLRVSRSRVVQRQVLHLGELNPTQLDVGEVKLSSFAVKSPRRFGEGFPLTCELFPGNRLDRSTRAPILDTIEKRTRAWTSIGTGSARRSRKAREPKARISCVPTCLRRSFGRQAGPNATPPRCG